MNSIIRLLFINFITMTAFNMAHPVTPKLINELQLPQYMFGVFFAGMAIANFVMAPIWGKLSDARGRKQFMILGVIGYGISQIGFGFNTQVSVILIFRVLGGAFAICYIIAGIAYMTDITHVEERVKYISYYTASGALGASVGAMLGGYVGQVYYQYTFIAQGVMSGIIAVIIYLIIKEKKIDKGEITIYLDHLKLSGTSIDFKTTIGSMIIVMIFIATAITSYNSTINYFIETVLNLPTTINGLVMSLAGIIALIMNVGVNPYLGKTVNEYVSIRYATLLAGVSILALGFVPNLMIRGVLLVIFISASTLVMPMQQSIVSKLAKDNQGEVLGLQGSARAIGMVIGSLSAGFLFGVSPMLPFVVSGICGLIAFVIIYVNTRKLVRE